MSEPFKMTLEEIREAEDLYVNRGPFACHENAQALTKCEEALLWLQKRTHDRMRRGVEGTNQH